VQTLTKVATKMIKNGVMGYLHGLQATFIKGIMKQILEMAMVRCIGRMAAIIKVIGPMESKMAKVNLNLFRLDFRPQGRLQERTF